jgi:hypothetical protein
MAGQICFGQIIWAEIADANGIKKARPAIVVTSNDQITPTGLLEVVAISSRLSDPLPDDHVLLPWHAQGHPRTGLNRKSAAVCSWVAVISRVTFKASQAWICPFGDYLQETSD